MEGKSGGAKPLQELRFPFSIKGEMKRGSASLTKPNPLPLIKGKGIKRIGLSEY